MSRMSWCVTAMALALAGLALLLGAVPAVRADQIAAALPPVTETDGRAGACYAFWDEDQGRPFLQPIYDAGSRWDRFDFIWPNIEPSNNNWSFDAYDRLVSDLQDAEINMVGILLWTPNWAATKGMAGLDAPSFDQRPFGWYAPIPHDAPLAPLAPNAASSPPQGLYLNWDDPNNHWGNYVYTVVSRYGDRVKHWEMWNEPEWDYFWTGTSADYAQLLKVGYRATKAACPDCTVLFGGLHYWANTNYYRWVLSQLNADPDAPANNYFFDVMSVHLYSRSSNTYLVINDIQAGMNAYNVGDHPIWLTETGVPVWGDPKAYSPKYDYAATQDEAAAYVIQSYANAWASGAGRYFFFRASDADMGEYFGLIRNDLSFRPAYTAYQVAATYLVSPTFVTRDSEGPYVRVGLWDTPRGKVTVVWNESPVTGVYTLPAAVSTATHVDRWGNVGVISAADGGYGLTLPGATANLVSDPDDYIIGGDPVLVIEAEVLNEPPTSSVDPLPAVVYSTTFTVAWSGWDSESGAWLYDIQVRDGEDGAWQDWQRLTSATSAHFTAGQGDHTYYFRCRASDGVGNLEVWPDNPQAYTTVDLHRTITFSIGTFFADDDRDDVFSPTSEITLTQVTLRLLDESGQDVMTPLVPLTPTMGSAFTVTVYAGQTYYLWAVGADHMRVLAFTWTQSGATYSETLPTLGLWPVTRVYLPTARRD